MIQGENCNFFETGGQFRLPRFINRSSQKLAFRPTSLYDPRRRKHGPLPAGRRFMNSVNGFQMKLIFSEQTVDYSHYQFGYAVWAVPEPGETPADIFQAGFLPS